MFRTHGIGRFVRDPELRTAGQTDIVRFTLATNRKFKKEGQPDADFVSCVAFGKMGNNICKYFHKGDLIYVNGHIQTGSYTNKDGNKVYTTDVVIDDWEFCGNNSRSGNSGQTTIDDYVNAGLDEFS